MLEHDFGGYGAFGDTGLFAGIAAIGVFVVVLVGMVALQVFFLLSMQRALNRCSPANRTLEPGMVWLQLIPVFGMVWSFFVVIRTSESLDAEVRSRNIPGMERNPGRKVGLAGCILSAWVSLVGWLPYVGLFLSFLPGIAAVACWIVFWTRISRTAGHLDPSPVPAGAA